MSAFGKGWLLIDSHGGLSTAPTWTWRVEEVPYRERVGSIRSVDYNHGL